MLRLAQEIERAGQQHRDRACFRHRGDARFVGVFEMIGGEGAEFRRQRRAATVAQLVGVEFHAQAMRLRGFEYAGGLLGRERDGLAERVDGIGELSRATAGIISRQTRSM